MLTIYLVTAQDTLNDESDYATEFTESTELYIGTLNDTRTCCCYTCLAYKLGRAGRGAAVAIALRVIFGVRSESSRQQIFTLSNQEQDSKTQWE